MNIFVGPVYLDRFRIQISFLPEFVTGRLFDDAGTLINILLPVIEK